MSQKKDFFFTTSSLMPLCQRNMWRIPGQESREDSGWVCISVQYVCRQPKRWEHKCAEGLGWLWLASFKDTVGQNVNWWGHYGEEYGVSLKKLNIKTTIWSSNSTPGHISGENHNSKRNSHPYVHCSTIYNSQGMQTT